MLLHASLVVGDFLKMLIMSEYDHSGYCQKLEVTQSGFIFGVQMNHDSLTLR